MSVHTKLMQARVALQKQEIKKSGRNTFANYSYMELGDFLIPTQTIFAELGLCGVVSFSAEYATLVITDTDDGSKIVITSPMGSAALKGCHEVQNIGAVETYQRRYLWVTAMEIVEHDALDCSPPVEKTAKGVPMVAADKRTPSVANTVLDQSEPIPAARKTELALLANKFANAMAPKGVAWCHDRLQEEGLDDVELIYFSTLLTSAHRNALKAESISRNQPEKV